MSAYRDIVRHGVFCLHNLLGVITLLGIEGISAKQRCCSSPVKGQMLLVPVITSLRVQMASCAHSLPYNITPADQMSAFCNIKHGMSGLFYSG